MFRRKGNILLAFLMVLLMFSSCSVRRQLKALRTGQLDTVRFNMPKRSASPNTISTKNIAQDTIIVKDAQGNEQFLMKAIEDEETGEPLDVDADDEEYGLVIMKTIVDNGEEILSTPDSDEELEEVYNLFMERFFEEEDE